MAIPYLFEKINMVITTMSALITCWTFTQPRRHMCKINHNKNYDIILKPCPRYQYKSKEYFNNIDESNEENKQEIKAYINCFQNAQIEKIEIDNLYYYAGNYDTSDPNALVGIFIEPPWQFEKIYETNKGKRKRNCANNKKQLYLIPKA